MCDTPVASKTAAAARDHKRTVRRATTKSAKRSKPASIAVWAWPARSGSNESNAGRRVMVNAKAQNTPNAT